MTETDDEDDRYRRPRGPSPAKHAEDPGDAAESAPRNKGAGRRTRGGWRNTHGKISGTLIKCRVCYRQLADNAAGLAAHENSKYHLSWYYYGKGMPWHEAEEKATEEAQQYMRGHSVAQGATPRPAGAERPRSPVQAMSVEEKQRRLADRMNARSHSSDRQVRQDWKRRSRTRARHSRSPSVRRPRRPQRDSRSPPAPRTRQPSRSRDRGGRSREREPRKPVHNAQNRSSAHTAATRERDKRPRSSGTKPRSAGIKASGSKRTASEEDSYTYMYEYSSSEEAEPAKKATAAEPRTRRSKTEPLTKAKAAEQPKKSSTTAGAKAPAVKPNQAPAVKEEVHEEADQTGQLITPSLALVNQLLKTAIREGLRSDR